MVEFLAAEHAGTNVTVVWTYVRATSGRRLRAERRLSASADGSVRILDYSMMEGDFAVEGDEAAQAAESAGDGSQGVAHSEPFEHHDVQTLMVFIGIVVGVIATFLYLAFRVQIGECCKNCRTRVAESTTSDTQQYKRIVRSEF